MMEAQNRSPTRGYVYPEIYPPQILNRDRPLRRIVRWTCGVVQCVYATINRHCSDLYPEHVRSEIYFLLTVFGPTIVGSFHQELRADFGGIDAIYKLLCLFLSTFEHSMVTINRDPAGTAADKAAVRRAFYESVISTMVDPLAAFIYDLVDDGRDGQAFPIARTSQHSGARRD
ncbi:hypothetical protein VTI74DRAFT_10554 [Chaetomium olivicolor]